MALLTNINGKFSVSDAGAVTFNNAFTFPTTDGAANYVLQTNGSGQLAWALNGNGDISGSGTANTVTRFTGTGSGVKTIGDGPITFSGDDSTFTGDVLVEDNLYLTDAGTVRGKLILNASDRDNVELRAESLGSTMKFFTAGTEALELDASQNATFAGLNVGIATSSYQNTAANRGSLTIGGSAAGTFNIGNGVKNFGIFATTSTSVLYSVSDIVLETGSSYTTALTIDASQNANFTGTVTAPTFLGNLQGGHTTGSISSGVTAVTQANAIDNTTVATTAYVNNKIGTIPAGLVFQGTWNASTNTPTLTSGSGTTGHFYIVSVAGSTNLDGITDWQVGDWAVFIEQGASDQWEKIDNSSVLDGFGTGQSVTKWDGSGTSNTLTNGPITFSGNNSTFAGTISSGNITSSATISGLTVIARDNLFVDAGQLYIGADNGSTDGSFRQLVGSGAFKLQKRISGTFTNVLDFNSSLNATFAGNSITVDPASGDAILQLQSSTQTLRVDQNSIRTTTNTNLSFLTNSTLALTLDTSQNATFEGSITAKDNITIFGNVKKLQWIDTQGNWKIESGNGSNKLVIHSESLVADYLTIKGDGVIQFNDYSAGTLVTDASGNISVSSGGGSGGPFLPLAGGTMTGNIIISTGKELIIGSQTAAESPLGITIRDNQGDVPVGIVIHNENTGTGADAAIAFETQGAMDFSIGLDRSDSSKFVMSRAGVLGTNNVFTIDNIGATFAGGVTSNAVPAFNVGTIGAIGNTANDLNIYSTTAGHNGLRMHANGILPTDNSGAIIDNDADLGFPTYRFKDLYLGGSIISNGGATFDPMVTITYSDISTGENKGLRIINTSGTDQQWNITAGITGQENESFCIRDSTANVNALTMAISSGNATFAGNVSIKSLVNANIGNLIITSTDNDASGLSFKVRSSPSDPTNSRSWMIHNNYSAAGNLQFLSSTTATGNPTTPRLTIDSSGNVGIGTTNPTSRLHVNGAGATHGEYLRISNGTAQIYELQPSIVNVTNNGFGIFDVTDNAYRLVIDTNGNVGIGVTSPSAKLEVLADVAKGVLINRTFTTSSQTLANIRAYYALAITPFRGGTGGLYFTNYDADVPIIQSVNTSDVAQSLLLNPLGGNVGIGNSSPDILGYGNTSKVLAVQGIIGTASALRPVVVNLAGQRDNGSNGFVSDLNFLNMASNGTTVNSRAIMRMSRDGADNSNQLEFFTANTGTTSQALTIDSLQNVGIGTDSPSAKLEIKSGNLIINNSGGLIDFRNGSGNSQYFLELANSNADLQINDRTGSGSVSMTIQSGGNIGIGVTGPSTKLEVAGHVTINSPAGASQTSYGLRFRKTNSSSVVQAGGEILASAYPINTNAANLIFKTANASANLTQRMVIDGVGNVGIGNTSPQTTLHVGTTTTVDNQFTNQVNASNFLINGNANGGASFFQCKTAAVNINMMGNNDFACNQFTFYHKPLSTSQNIVGTITTFSSSTQYNTSSDYRLKENVIPLSNSITRLKQLKPSRFNFIEDTERTMDGFLAHEVQDIVPEAVNGEKDAVDKNGNEVHQGIDQAKLVPLLTAAIQEQQKIIDDLKSRIEQLEN